ncbi:hypothetical protein [Mesoplasma lactucae]|uniref:Uncharacterized protein n=1 Tax=Mesoplasma lactucae ATCC 49193 TaxID=81460 RepID=A0A291IRD9_9MOLU|nr:hypothetical protein [Mesoplasma lactucae]ATG97505.1 hypothetical protein CP520_01925 [Mesoplasma lactucae ATCC 49193]ATZ20039.1 hypothetical protein MLACT_v1c02170 [Mesoplasma lactucae ATCC 49193]MCL8217010.1 hypothetical protein [Mesoplasma lactucae ATCC 49193]
MKNKVSKKNKCKYCGKWITYGTHDFLCSICLENKPRLLVLKSIEWLAGYHKAVVHCDLFDEGEFWYTDSITIQFGKNIVTRGEAYKLLESNPEIIVNNFDFNSRSTNTIVRFPRYPKELGINVRESRNDPQFKQ